LHNFFEFFKNVILSKNSPQFLSRLPNLSFLEQSSSQENEFGAEIWKRWSPIRLAATVQRIFKNS